MVFVWDVAAGNIIRRLQGHFGKINAVAFNQDSQVLASGALRLEAQIVSCSFHP